uniref:Retroviral polymerase SH3-like domain-containing protein n=1 Tax=Cannabis sativa TaxID=3483 RepID=A0A803NM80_CANSA
MAGGDSCQPFGCILSDREFRTRYPRDDLRSRSLIGAGERKDGLYYFRRIPTVCAITVPEISDFELWHRRLRHPSDRVVKLVPAISSRNLPITFWGECVLGAVYLINRTPSGLLQNKTPFEILFGHTPTFDELKVFGCLAFAHNQNAKGNKFAPRSRKCVFIGYPYGKKGWKLYDLQTGDIFVSRDVKFHENEFPYATASTSQVPTPSLPLPDSNVGINVDFSDDLENILVDDHATPTIGTDDVLERPSPIPLASTDALGRGLRDKRPSVVLRDFVTHILSLTTDDIEPRSFKEAMQYEGWRKAMQQEIAALEANGTWEMRKYSLDIIAEVGLLGSRPAGFPIEQNHTLALAKGPLLIDPERYRRLVGRLIYLSFTRPDLVYTVHILAQFMQHPLQDHWDAALRTVRYLKGCLGQGILLRTDCELSLTALYIAQNPVFHERTEHIEVDYHYVRDAIRDGIISMYHVSTDDQLADIFTKALGKRKFLYLLGKLGIYDLHAPT